MTCIKCLVGKQKIFFLLDRIHWAGGKKRKQKEKGGSVVATGCAWLVEEALCLLRQKTDH